MKEVKRPEKKEVPVVFDSCDDLSNSNWGFNECYFEWEEYKKYCDEPILKCYEENKDYFPCGTEPKTEPFKSMWNAIQESVRRSQ